MTAYIQSINRIFISLFAISLLIACGSSGSDSDVNPNSPDDSDLTGSVTSYFGGEALANVDVSVRYGNQTLTAKTNAQGVFSISTFTTEERITLNADAEGYSEHAKILSPNEPLADQLAIRLQPADVIAAFDSSSQNSFTLNDLTLLELAANSLVDANGNAFQGTATAEITVIDPALDSGIMPGDYLVQPENGSSDILESFGAIAVSFQSSQGELNLASGQQATIRIPVSSLYDENSAPSTMPLYYFNEATGFWVEEGSATLEVDAVTGEAVYVGQVSHFTVWNADQPLNTVTLTGCVYDQLDNPLSDVRINSDGRSYIGTSSAYSDEQGCYSIDVRIDSDLILYFTGNGQSQVLEWHSSDLSVDDVSLSVSEFAIKLTWGALPEDLDAHLITPSGEVSYQSVSIIDDGFYALLDVDDMSSFGPEVISGSAFNKPGCYEYYVENYTQETAWDQTNAKVNVTLEGEERQYLVAQVSAQPEEFEDVYKLWSVFTAEVDNNLNMTINWRNQLVNDTYCQRDDFDDVEFNNVSLSTATYKTHASKTKAPKILSRK